MEFKYSCIGDNTQENREWLEKVGYVRHLDSDINGNYIKTQSNGMYYLYSISEWSNNVVNCIGNPQLFKAVSAMRNDSDYMQWFTDGKEWFLCKRDEFRGYSEFSNSYPEFWGYNYHKATLTELQERFKLN